MKKTLLSVSLAAVASLGFAQSPTFTQVARYTLNGANLQFAPNNTPAAVAFDGTNAYVASASNGADGTTLYKVSNALSNTGQGATVFATQAGAAGGGRWADLAAANNSVYWGFGLGDGTTGAQSKWGVARYNMDGSLNTGFGTGGIVSSSVGPARFDSMAIDPSNGRVGIAAYTRGFVWEIDPLTGANTTNLTFPTTPNTAWRSIAFDGSGNLYGRNNDGPNVREWTRSGTTLTNQKDLATVGTVASAAQKLGFVAGNGFDSFLLANNYNSSSTGVSVLSASTGAALTTLTGTEDGLGSAFGNSAGVGMPFGFSSAVVNGSTYVFVTGISGLGGEDALAIYRVGGAAPVPEPATLAALGFGALALLRRRRKG